MANYIVSYDLHNQRVYAPVWAYLQTLNGVRLLESLWLVSTSLTAVQIRDGLANVIDADDSIVVVEVSHGAWWAAIRAMPPGVAFLKNHVHA